MKVYAAIREVMKDLGELGIGKDSKNKDQGYMFRGIDAVYLALNPLLVKHNLVVLPRHINRWSETRPTKSGGTMSFVTVEVEFDFVQAEDGSKHTIRICGEGMDTADKATNKANSAAYKYAMFEAFCIPTEATDGDAETPSMNQVISHKEAVNSVNIEEKANEAAFKFSSSKTLKEAMDNWSKYVAPIYQSLDKDKQAAFERAKEKLKGELK